MSLNRREFIVLCGGAVAAGTLGRPAWPASSGAAERKIWMVEELTKDVFKAHIGEDFTVKSETPPGDATLRLTELAEAPERLTLGPDGKPLMESFRLKFVGTAEHPLPQRIYEFEHATLGAFSLFMVPVVSEDPAVRHYEVVFNRLLHRP